MKLFLTIFHCVIALIITVVGAFLANGLVNSQPMGAFLVAVISVVLPVLIATRVSWASGYEHGFRDGATTKQNTIPQTKVDV
jgi:hypothetical protein